MGLVELICSDGLGKLPEVPNEIANGTHGEYLNDGRDNRERHCGDHKSTAQASQKLRDDNCNLLQFDLGDCVLIYNPALSKGQSSKFREPWKGPYAIIRKPRHPALTSLVRDEKTGKLSYVHPDRMKFIHRTSVRKETDIHYARNDLEIEQAANRVIRRREPAPVILPEVGRRKSPMPERQWIDQEIFGNLIDLLTKLRKTFIRRCRPKSANDFL